jgi:hypothetical protein
MTPKEGAQHARLRIGPRSIGSFSGRASGQLADLPYLLIAALAAHDDNYRFAFKKGHALDLVSYAIIPALVAVILERNVISNKSAGTGLLMR